MRKTRMGRELRKESIACRPCSLNFVDKLLREVPDRWHLTSYTDKIGDIVTAAGIVP